MNIEFEDQYDVIHVKFSDRPRSSDTITTVYPSFSIAENKQRIMRMAEMGFDLDKVLIEHWDEFEVLYKNYLVKRML